MDSAVSLEVELLLVGVFLFLRERRLSRGARRCLPLSLSLLASAVFLPIVAGISCTCADMSRWGAREAEEGWIVAVEGELEELEEEVEFEDASG